MNVASEMLALAGDRSSIAVVGTSKNAGKTVTIAALCEELSRRGEPFGLVSIGRDGEALDAVDGAPKPRLFLRPGTLFATARARLPEHPAVEIVSLPAETSALGKLAIARVRAPGFFEIVGPPSAAALRRIVAELRELGAKRVVIDGAVDRIAGLRGGSDAVVVASGAAGGPTVAHVAALAAGLVARLRLPVVDPSHPALAHAGALTAADALRYVHENERRQIVVGDATQIAISGRSFLGFARQLDFRVERALAVVAGCIASIALERAFEPLDFGRAVAAATSLPVFNVYASQRYLPAQAA